MGNRIDGDLSGWSDIPLMDIKYETRKDLPCKDLYELFLAVGWTDKNITTQNMLENFNIGFVNSTFVFSAWDNKRLVGCVRVLSDLHFRSVILDLAVLPEYQRKGIGKKIGFVINEDHFLRIPGRWC